MVAEVNQKKQRILTGRVTSNKMDKTIVVLIERRVRHDTYKKTITRFTKLHAHDANNECGIGDVVEIGEVKPIARTKRWALVNIVEKAQ